MAAVAILFALSFSLLAQQPLDILITGARVVDGSGNPYFYADIGIRGDTIVALGHLRGLASATKLDAAGLTVTPGFLDVHNHSYPAIFDEPTAKGYLYQGVTTLIGGPDGASPVPLKSALDKLARFPMSVNMGLCIGHGSIRRLVMNMDNRKPTPQELTRMKEMARQGMLDGAMGLSTGLFYTPASFADTEEVIELAKVAGEYGGFHVSHIRDEAGAVVEAVKETIRIGEEGGLPTQITHHKVGGKANRGKSADTLRLIDEARARGVDVTVDQYPYTASHTSLGAALIPQWAFGGGNKALLERLAAPEQRQRIKAEIVRRIEGERGGGDPRNIVLTDCPADKSLNRHSLADILRSRRIEPDMDNAAELVIEIQKGGGCSAVFHWVFEDDLERIMRYPYTMIASDGSITMAHPRSYGTFARVLARYVRERKVLRLEDAVHKMSGLPAQRLRIYDRGLVRPGMKADLVILDPAKIMDNATFDEPFALATGVRDVVVNGRIALRNGAITAERAGRVLYGPGYQPR
ncbi:MAG: D-aminoacylase [Bryobacterales bacterium]|nr:D-aminoacylase [Bryobacterales bacterium]